MATTHPAPLNAGPVTFAPSSDNVAAYVERLEATARRLNHAAGAAGPVVYLDDREPVIARDGLAGWLVVLCERTQWVARSGRTMLEVQMLEIGAPDEPARLVPLADFLRDNAEDLETCAAVLGLERVGDRVKLGGGSAPVVHVRRFS